MIGHPQHGYPRNARRFRAATAAMLLCALASLGNAQGYGAGKDGAGKDGAGKDGAGKDGADKATAGHSPRATQPLRFIRVFVPADQPELWPRGQGRYLPLDVDEFERLLERAKARGRRTAAPAANISAAEYRAWLDADGILHGTARLKVSHRGKDPVLLPLAPCRLVIKRASWLAGGNAEEEKAGRKTQAVLGTGPSGRMGLVVERRGTLSLGWMLRGKGGTIGKKLVENGPADGVEIEYSLALPPCPTNVLLLDLPPDFVPQVEGAMVLPSLEPPSSPVAAGQAGTRRWRIELGARHRFELRLTQTGRAAGARPAVRARQSLVYDLTEEGLEVSSAFRLDAAYSPIGRVEIIIDHPLKVVRAQCGDKPASWSVMPGGDGKTDRVTLELPGLVQGSDVGIGVWAYGPVVTERTWRLPRIRAKCVSSGATGREEKIFWEQIFWEQGEATLIVADPLQIIDLKKIDCRQSKTGRLPPPASGESVLLQLFSPDATAEIVLTQAVSPPTVDCGIAARLDTGDITAQVTANFRGTRQKYFRIEADLAAGWIVDSVESLPAGVVDDWNVEDMVAKDGDDGSRRLVARLSKPLSASQGPLRLLVALRSPRSPLGRKLSADDLMPLVFSNCDRGKMLLAIHAMEPHQLKYWGDAGLSLRETGGMDADELRLFAGRPKGLFLSLENTGQSLQFSLQRQRPSYDAVIRVEARVADDMLTESYHISCTPRSSQVERLLVHFSRARDSQLRWRLGWEDDRQVAARRLPASEEAAAGLGGDGETWEISLRQPRGIPFEIEASRTCKLDEKTEVCLAALPEASQQKATLVLKSPDLSGRRFENRRLEPITPQPAQAGRFSTIRAAYRYDPLQTISSPQRTTLTVLPKTKKGSAGEDNREAFPSAWVWSCHLESFHNTDGTASHWACYHIENAGRDRLTLDLPENIDPGNVEDVWVNNRPDAWQTTAKEGKRSLHIDLPAAVRFPLVTIHFTTTSSPLGISESLQPVLPAADIPMLARRWTAWLPPGYSSLAKTHETVDGYTAPCASPSLAQRIFGPLGQPSHGKIFDPFSAADWKETAAAWLNPSADERPVAILLERMGRISSQKTTAGSVLNNESLLAVERLLLVDAKALARDGISPATPLLAAANGRKMPDTQVPPVRPPLNQLPPAPLPPDLQSARGIDAENASAHEKAQDETLSADEAMGGAIRLLRRSGLAILAHDEAILLTTASQAAVYADHLEPLVDGVIWRVCPGPLSDWISTESNSQNQNDGQGTLVSASHWAASPSGPTSPWAPFTQTPLRSSGTPGWTAVRLDISDADGPGLPIIRLPIIHRQTLAVFRYAAFIMAIAIGCWKGMDRTLATVIAAAAFAVLALLTPILVSSICSGVVLGLLFCLLLKLVRRKASPDEPKSSVSKAKPSASDSTAAYISGGIVLAIVLLSSSMSEAADTAGVYRVFVPVDKEREAADGQVSVPVDKKNKKAAGGRVFVPEELYGQLQRRAAGAMGRPRGWLITSAAYHGTLTKHGRPEQLSIGSLRAVFEIRLFDSEAEVRIPLKKSDVSLTASNCLLDGREARPRWSEDGESLVVHVEQTGRHRLELALQPVEKPNALDMAVRWSDGSSSPSVEPSVEAEELLWLKIRPGSVVVEAKFSLKVNSGEVSELTLDADPRLRLLEHGATADIVEVPGKPRVRIMRLAAPCSDHVVVTARFLLREGSGVGNIRPPLLRLSKVATSVQWLAVSIDPSLDSRQLGRRPATPANVSEFIASWGNSKETPQNVYSLADIGPTWSISTRPRRPRVDVAQSLRVTFAQERIGLRLDAKLTDTPGYGFQYRIAVPQSLVVEKVSVIEEGVERVSRWTRGGDDDSAVNIFLTGPAAVARELSLEGHMPAPPQGKLRVPMFQLENAKQVSNRIALFRDPSVLVSIVKNEGLIVSDWPGAASWPKTVAGAKKRAAASAKAANRGRLAKSFIADGRRAVNLVVALSENLPKIKIVQVTSLSPNGNSNGGNSNGGDSSVGSWQASVDLQISVDGGLLDEVVLDVPPEFGGPYKLKQPGTIEVVDMPGRQRQLVIRTSLPISGKDHLTIVGPLSSDPVAAPRITPHGAGKIKHTLILPERQGNKPIAWETRGLKKTAAPGGHEVVGSRFHAVLLPSEKGHANAVVRLADISIAWRENGTCTGTATFDLQPDGRRWCPLWLPRNFLLIETRLENVVAVPLPVRANLSAATGEQNAGEQNAGRKYRIQLASRTMPQRIEVVFRGRLSPNQWNGQWNGRKPFAAPRLGDLPVEQSLWRVSGPRTFAPCLAATSDDRLEHELIRHKTLAAIIERAAASSGPKTDELLNWYRPWARRHEYSRQEVQLSLSNVKRPELVRSTLAELKKIDSRQLAIATSIAAEDVLHGWLEKPPLADDAGGLWQTTLASSPPTALLAERGTDGTESRGDISFYQTKTSNIWSRLNAAFAIVVFICIIRLGIKRGLLPMFTPRWLYLLGTAGGLFWWLFLSPSLVGLIIVAACLAASVRPGRRYEL